MYLISYLWCRPEGDALHCIELQSAELHRCRSEPWFDKVVHLYGRQRLSDFRTGWCRWLYVEQPHQDKRPALWSEFLWKAGAYGKELLFVCNQVYTAKRFGFFENRGRHHSSWVLGQQQRDRLSGYPLCRSALELDWSKGGTCNIGRNGGYSGWHGWFYQ